MEGQCGCRVVLREEGGERDVNVSCLLQGEYSRAKRDEQVGLAESRDVHHPQ